MILPPTLQKRALILTLSVGLSFKGEVGALKFSISSGIVIQGEEGREYWSKVLFPWVGDAGADLNTVLLNILVGILRIQSNNNHNATKSTKVQ